MLSRIVLAGMLAGLQAPGLLADFRYEQTSRLTGGMMAGVMKFAGAFSGRAREPIRTEVLVKGDRMAHWSRDSVSVIDLSKQTITEINLEKKQYSVVTFEQMKQALERMASKMQSQGTPAVKVSVKDGQQSREIQNLTARLMLLAMDIEAKDPESGRQGAMTLTAELWLAPDVPGYQEVREFYRRMGESVDWMPGTRGLAQGRSEIARAMADAYKEAAKLEGVPLLQVVRVGMKAEGTGTGGGKAPQQAKQPEEAESEAPSSIRGALGRLGGFGGFGRRKKKEPEAEKQAAASAATPGLLMEVTTELAGFSSGPVEASKFEVPAGFQQVESDLLKALH